MAMFLAATGIGLALAAQWGRAPVVLLYLPPVLAAAAYAGRWPALLTAVAATLAYNFFFTEPTYTLLIRDPGDVVTVAMLLMVGLVTSHLVTSLRQQGELAAFHASRNATIAGFARRLLSCGDAKAIAEVAAGELAAIFDCHACMVAGQPEARLLAGAAGVDRLTEADLAVAAQALAKGEPAGRHISGGSLTDWQFYPVRAGAGALAVAGLARSDGAPPVEAERLSLLENLLDQVALALERARLESAGRENIVLRERDSLRTALLGSIGHDIRPRLHAIAAGLRKLQRAGSVDGEVLHEVAGETGRLSGFIDNLADLDLAQSPDPVVAGAVAIDLYRRTVTLGDEPVHLTPKEFAVLAELARNAGRVLTHRYLLRAVWGPAHEEHVDYLRVAVSALRKKLGDEVILNEPAVGYRLAVQSAQ
jgi:two-component system, OmpR family, sensor histidine kinase KdpD